MPNGQQLIDIIAGCASAKRESQKELYKLYYSFASGICMRYCNTDTDVVEIVNDGYLKVFTTIGNFTARYDNIETSFMGWLKKIMIFTAIDHYRKNAKHHYSEDINEIHISIIDASETSIDKMAYKEIIAVVQKLTPAYRTVFNMYVIDGYKHEEIAMQLNISIGTSKSNLAKARQNIQKMLSTTNEKRYEQRSAI